jgi:hypothetical protein
MQIIRKMRFLTNKRKGNEMTASRILATALAIIFGLFLVQQAEAYILNDYFGVDLTVNSEGAFNMSWDPVVGHMIHENWRTDGDMHAPDPGPRYYISEAFDIEAMYLDINTASEQVIFSIVTSMPNTGFSEVPWYPGYVFRAGDIRFGVGANTYVLGTFGSFTGNMYYNPSMTYTDGYRGFGDRGNPLLANSNLGSELTTSGIFDFDYMEYRDAGNNPLIENGYGTYVMEGVLSFADLGAPDFDQSGLSMTLAMSCNNDIATVAIAPVPEPTTVALLGLGLIGIYARTRFRKKQ